MTVLSDLLTAAALCADCFAISLCSGISLHPIRGRQVLRLAMVFACIQTLLLALGWAFASFFTGLRGMLPQLIASVLLLWVGVSMLRDGWQDKREAAQLQGWKNVLLAGIATSLDALNVGAARCLTNKNLPRMESLREMQVLLIAVFVITALSVVFGLLGGGKIADRYGRYALLGGGVILIVLALLQLR